jgi:hypothetical protein
MDTTSMTLETEATTSESSEGDVRMTTKLKRRNRARGTQNRESEYVAEDAPRCAKETL